jgi:DNA-directed RNA polymerase subunit RPC12/RpoP
MSESHEGGGGAGGAGFDVQVECPACGAKFAVSRIRRGATEACPVCRFKVLIPDRDAQEEELAVPGPAEHEETPAQEALLASAVAAAPGAATGSCFVCLQDEVRINPMQTAGIVGGITGRSDMEVKMQVAKGQGVLAEDVPTDVAREVVSVLCQGGVQVFAVDAGCVPQVERELRIIRVHDLAPDMMQFQTGPYPDIQAIAWDALAAGFCAQELVAPVGHTDTSPEVEGGLTAASMLGGGIISAAARDARRGIRAVPRQPEAKLFCTLLVRGRSGHAYSIRFEETQVRYAYMGDRMTTSKSRNFAHMLGDFIARGRDAFFPGRTREVAAGHRLKAALMKQAFDYQKYLQWVLCCVGYQWHAAPGAQGRMCANGST